jgi:hypothetical protein
MAIAKMIGPYKQIEGAIEAGFGHIRRMGDSNKKEYAFVAALKVQGTSRSYCYSEPTTSNAQNYVNLNIELAAGLMGRAFCHNHPDNIADAGFGSDDAASYSAAAKNGSTLVWYMMNKFNEIRVANSQSDFPGGKVTGFKPKP